MKLNEPITEEEHAKADDEHRRLIEAQKRHLLELADKVLNGEPFDKMDAGRIAAALRFTAKQLNPIRNRPAGRPAKIRDDCRLVYADLRTHEGFSQNAAIERIAEMYQVSTTAVKKKLGLIGSEPERSINKADTNLAFRLVGGTPET